MRLLRHIFSRVAEDLLLVALLIAAGPLLLLNPVSPEQLLALVDWKTIAALAGLMVLSRGLEDSGFLARGGRWLVTHVHGERRLAAALVLFSALLSAVVTNDVALFIVVPLTLALRTVADLPIGRLVIFEALAVNAGSTASPVGNPQNLYLWQSSPVGFVEFLMAMLPLGTALLVLILLLVPFAFPAQRIDVASAAQASSSDRLLLWLSLALYPVFLVATELGHAPSVAIGVVTLYLVAARRVLLGVDWLLLLVFMLMFVDLGLLAGLPAVQTAVDGLMSLPGGLMTAGILLSQLISNVPATIFLYTFTDDWRLLAWSVSIGGFGLAIGSLANLIALRLARQPGLWRGFHAWSMPMLALSWLAAWMLA